MPSSWTVAHKPGHLELGRNSGRQTFVVQQAGWSRSTQSGSAGTGMMLALEEELVVVTASLTEVGEKQLAEEEVLVWCRDAEGNFVLVVSFGRKEEV